MEAVKILVLICFIAFGSSAMAQNTAKKMKPWVCTNGFWVVESNRKMPLDHKVRFYTSAGLLIEERVVTGTRLNVNRKKVKMELKQMLETIVLAWEQKQLQGGWVKKD